MTGWYTHGLANGRALRVKISGLATPAAFREAVVEFFAAESASSGVPETRPASGIAFPVSESGAVPSPGNPIPGS